MPADIHVSTRQVSRLLGMTPGAFSKSIWAGKVTPPNTRLGGSYVWGLKEIEVASWAIRHRAISEDELAQLRGEVHV
jgi:hypothetical protein